MPSLANTERNQSKHDDCILYTFFDIVTHTGMQIILLVSFRQQQQKILETDIPLRSETPRYFYKMNWSSFYVLLVFKLRYNETCPFLTQNPNTDIQKPCLF